MAFGRLRRLLQWSENAQYASQLGVPLVFSKRSVSCVLPAWSLFGRFAGSADDAQYAHELALHPGEGRLQVPRKHCEKVEQVQRTLEELEPEFRKRSASTRHLICTPCSLERCLCCMSPESEHRSAAEEATRSHIDAEAKCDAQSGHHAAGRARFGGCGRGIGAPPKLCSPTKRQPSTAP